MALVKYNNNSISDLTSAGQLAQGKMTLISEQTASASASISFTSGIDSTYPIYKFEFINMHPATNNVGFSVNFRDGGTNYDATKTTTAFRAYNAENNEGAALEYETGRDLAQSTSAQKLTTSTGNDNDKSVSGTLHLFNPSSTTFVKNFIAQVSTLSSDNYNYNNFTAGYCNVTAAIDGVQFTMSSGNIDSGTIKLYGIKGD
jgi:hypothetical protein